MTTRKRVPTRGAALVASIRAEMDQLGCVPTSTEEELLRVGSTLADRLEELERIIARDGVLITNAKGDLRPHPAAIEHRATATSLARTLNSIYLGESTSAPRKNPVKQRAARVRWSRDQRAANGQAS